MKKMFAMALAAAATVSVYAEDIAKDVKTLTNVKGTIAIDSAKVKAGEAAAKISLQGTGELKQQDVGKHGYIIFRYKGTGWWDANVPHVNVTAPFSYIPNPKPKARFKDRLYSSVKRKDINLTVDGEKANGPSGIQGAVLWNAPKAQTAYWDIKVDDDKEHTLTVLTGNGAAATFSVAPLANPTAKQQLAVLEQSQGAVILQFTFKGGIRLYLEQTAFTKEDKKNRRKSANISSIFVD